MLIPNKGFRVNFPRWKAGYFEFSHLPALAAYPKSSPIPVLSSPAATKVDFVQPARKCFLAV